MIDSAVPPFGVSEYRRRVRLLRERMNQAKISKVIVYSDEYHFENLAYFCGYRPIFEMALLIIGIEGNSLLITGHEGKSLAELTAIDCQIETYNPFSTQGMSAKSGADILTLLKLAGIFTGMRIGLIGPRYFLEAEIATPNLQHAVPSFIIEAIAAIVDSKKCIINTTAWLTQLPGGLRSLKSASEIAYLEEAGTRASRGVIAMLNSIKPGMTERELLGYAQKKSPSSVYSYPPVLHSGIEKCNAGLLGPSERIINKGDPVVIYYSPAYEGYSGNSGRSALLAEKPNDRLNKINNSLEMLFSTTHQSYLSIIRDLQAGAVVNQLVEKAIQLLNAAQLITFYTPIHSTGLSEWENAFDFSDSTNILQPGHVIQVDFTVFSKDFPLGPAKIEDGFAIVDNAIKEELKLFSPNSWKRISQRINTLQKAGIFLDPSVLPLSDLAGQFFPYLLSSKYHLLTENLITRN